MGDPTATGDQGFPKSVPGLASREGVWARDFVADLGFGATRPTPLYLDSRAAIELAKDPVSFKLTKHILRHAHELQDRVARRVYEPVFVESENQLADVLTKAMRPGQHSAAVARLLDVSRA